jgi:hypothetical protein
VIALLRDRGDLTYLRLDVPTIAEGSDLLLGVHVDAAVAG